MNLARAHLLQEKGIHYKSSREGLGKGSGVAAIPSKLLLKLTSRSEPRALDEDGILPPRDAGIHGQDGRRAGTSLQV